MSESYFETRSIVTVISNEAQGVRLALAKID